jgi:hypothetical protein
MAIQTVHELLSDDPWGDPEALMFGTLALPGTNSIGNLVMRGHSYDVTCGPNVTSVTRDGHQLFHAIGGRVAVRNFLVNGSRISFDVNATDRTQVVVQLPRGRTRKITVPKGKRHVTL